MFYAPWSSIFSSLFEKQETISFLGRPYSRSHIRLFKNKLAEKLDTLNFNIKSPWFEASRSYSSTQESIQVEDKFKLLKSFITPEEIKSEEFKKIKNEIQKYFERSLIVFSSPSPS